MHIGYIQNYFVHKIAVTIYYYMNINCFNKIAVTWSYKP